MKKLIPKKFRNEKATSDSPTRITNETVAEHREQILAGGRKFKYPIQYARHRLVINTLIVATTSIVVLLALAWWQLYIVQNSSTFMYRLTKIVPVPVAVVDGQFVPFDDYLARYRFNEFWLDKYGEVKLNTKDGENQLKYIKREVMNLAIEDAYAAKLASARNISVSNQEVEEMIASQRNTANGTISEETYYSALQMTNGWDKSDLTTSLRRTILRNKVAFDFDSRAADQVKQVESIFKTNGDLASAVSGLAESKGGKVSAGDTGFLNKTSTFGGLQISQVADLEKGKIFGPLKSSTDEGYYFVKVNETTETQVNFSYLRIPLTMFKDKIAELKKSGQVQEYIKIESK